MVWRVPRSRCRSSTGRVGVPAASPAPGSTETSGCSYGISEWLNGTSSITDAVGVAVASDTTSYLPRALVAERGIHEVSLYVSLDGHQQREAEILDHTDRFYDALRATQD